MSTAAIRNLFGSRLASAYAPTVLASFGSGKTRIDVRVIAHDGAASYLAALKADLQQRKTGGQALASRPADHADAHGPQADGRRPGRRAAACS